MRYSENKRRNPKAQKSLSVDQEKSSSLGRRSKISADCDQVFLEMPHNVLKNTGSPALDDNFFELLSRCQGNRMEEQRAELPSTKSQRSSGRSKSNKLTRSKKVNSITQEDMFELIIKSQESRINDQRCEPELIQKAPTVPDEDFFGLILRLQSNRIDEQRCSLPESRRANSTKAPTKSHYRKESQL